MNVTESPEKTSEKEAQAAVDAQWSQFFTLIRQLSAREKADYWRCYLAIKAGTATEQERQRQTEYHIRIGCGAPV